MSDNEDQESLNGDGGEEVCNCLGKVIPACCHVRVLKIAIVNGFGPVPG